MSTKRSQHLMGCNIRPGHTPGGFSRELPLSSGEHNTRRKSQAGRYDKYKEVIAAANKVLGDSRFSR